MCLDFPAQVVSVRGDSATVRVDGRTRQASTIFLPDVRAGEWVHVAAGTILTRLTTAEAAYLTRQISLARSNEQ